MNEVLEIKKKIKLAIFDKIFDVNEVISITIVGSFVDKDDLSGISDIDIVVICNTLNKKIFTKCVNSFKKLNISKCGLKIII